MKEYAATISAKGDVSTKALIVVMAETKQEAFQKYKEFGYTIGVDWIAEVEVTEKAKS